MSIFIQKSADMKVCLIKTVPNDDIVAGGLYLNVVLNWWQICLIVSFFVFLIYIFIRKRRQRLRKSR
jgi:hypothetical protein